MGERNADLKRVIASSFGLLGVVHEVLLRVQPLTPVKIDYQVLNLKEFGARFASIIAAPGALRLHISPFKDEITVERRTIDDSANITRSGIWQDSQVRDAQRAAGVRLDRGQRARSARRRRRRGLRRAARTACDARQGGRGTSSCTRTNGCATCRRRRGSRATPIRCGASRRPTIRGSSPSTSHSAAPITSSTDYRCNVVNGASRLHQDRGSLFSVSYAGPMFTLEPSSTGERGWARVPDRFQRFRLGLGRSADFQPDARPEAGPRGAGVRRACQTVPRPAQRTDRSIGCATAISPICWSEGRAQRRPGIRPAPPWGSMRAGASMRAIGSR